jgi:zinc transporter, ZIP family
MLEAAFWGFVGGVALLLGAGLGLLWRTPSKVIGLVMAFGSDVLISAVAFELTAKTFRTPADSPWLSGWVPAQ